MVSSKLHIDMNEIPNLRNELRKLEIPTPYKTQDLSSLIPQRFSRRAKNQKDSASSTNPYFKTPSDKDLRTNFKKNLRKYVLKKRMINALQKQQSPPSQIHLNAASTTSRSPEKYKNYSSTLDRHEPGTSTANRGTEVGTAADVYSRNRPNLQSNQHAPVKLSDKKVSQTPGARKKQNKNEKSCIGCFSKLLHNNNPNNNNQRIFYSFEAVRPIYTRKNKYATPVPVPSTFRSKKQTQISPSPNMTFIHAYTQPNVQVSGLQRQSPRLKVLQNRSGKPKTSLDIYYKYQLLFLLFSYILYHLVLFTEINNMCCHIIFFVLECTLKGCVCVIYINFN